MENKLRHESMKAAEATRSGILGVLEGSVIPMLEELTRNVKSKIM